MVMQYWQVLILLSVLFNAVAVVLQRVVLREQNSDPVAYSIVFQLISGSIIGAFGWVTGNLQFPPDIAKILLFMGLMIVLYGFGNVFIFQALKAIEASKFTILFATRTLFTILASTLFLNESLNTTQWIGALLILFSVILVTVENTKITFGKWEFFTLLAAAAFGFEVTNDRYILTMFPLYTFVSLAFVLPALMMWMVNVGRTQKIFELFHKTNLIRICSMAVVYAVSAILFFSSLQIAPNSSQVITINLTSVVVTVLLAVVFLGERKNLFRKLLGATLCFIGLLLVD